jgi:hypothetical protein
MTYPAPTTRNATLLRAAALVFAVTLPLTLSAQAADRVIADTPSRSSATRMQHDSLTVHFLRSPKAKPAALSVGGKTAAQARKFNGKPDAEQPSAPVFTPLPVRERTAKP